MKINLHPHYKAAFQAADMKRTQQMLSVIRQIKYCLLPQIKNNFLRYAEALQSVLFATISAHCFM